MVRKSCCYKEGVNKGAWSAKEDKILVNYIKVHGEGKWRDLPKRAGLNRCGKSCRLRWLNYLRPDIKRGNFSPDEEDLIFRLHKNSLATGRTDKEIENHWNCYLSKKIKANQSHAKPPEPSNYREYSSKEKNSSSLDSDAAKTYTDGSNPVTRTKAVRFTKVIDLPMQAANDSVNKTSSKPEGEETQRPSSSIPKNETDIISCPDFLLDFGSSSDLLMMPDLNAGPCGGYQSREVNEQFAGKLVAEADPMINIGHYLDNLALADHLGDEACRTLDDSLIYEAKPGNWMVGGFFQPNEAPMDPFTLLHSEHEWNYQFFV